MAKNKESTPEYQFRSDIEVKLIKASASDADVLFAARVSTQGEQTLAAALEGDEADEKSKGLINYLTVHRSSTTR
jgi:thymidylate synthase (FAD)